MLPQVKKLRGVFYMQYKNILCVWDGFEWLWSWSRVYYKNMVSFIQHLFCCVLWSTLLSWPLINLYYAACCWMLYQTRSTTCRHTMFISLHVCFSGSLEPVKPRSSLRDQFRSILAGFGKFQSFKHKIVAKMWGRFDVTALLLLHPGMLLFAFSL